MTPGRQFYLTSSPSMDILISNNLERLLYLLSGRDGKAVSDWMKALEADKVYEVSEKVREGLTDFTEDSVQREAREAIAAPLERRGISCRHSHGCSLQSLQRLRRGDWRRDAGGDSFYCQRI